MPRYLITALIVACALFMENLDATVISTSLPAIALDLHDDPISLKLAMTSYLVSLAIFIPASGWVADRYGAKTIFRIAIVVFSLGSIFCGWSSSLPELVAARVLQGLGGAMMTPVGRLLLLRSVNRSDLVRALSYLSAPSLLGPLVGPLVGGFITTYFHWRWIFWINVPIGILGIVFATIFIEDIREEKRWPLDVTGLLLSGVGLACLVFGLAMSGRGAESVETSILLVGAGALCLTAYVFHARRAAFPLIDLRLLSYPSFSASVTGGSLFRIGIGAIPFLLPLMLQAGFGMSPFQSGSITFIASAGSLLMKATAAPILRAFGFRRALIIDAILSAAFLASYGFFTPDTPIVLMMGVLLMSGFINCLGFTGIGVISYAEIDASEMSRAVSFTAVAQQLSTSLGISAGAGALQSLARINAGSDVFALENFRWAFVAVALITLSSVVSFLSLPKDAGSDLARRRATPAKPTGCNANAEGQCSNRDLPA